MRLQRLPSPLSPLLCALLARVASGCASLAGPRVDRPLDRAALASTPAFVDASRAWPIAFFAAPETAQETMVDVGGARRPLRTADWLHQLALELNTTLQGRGLFDERTRVVQARAMQRMVSEGYQRHGIPDQTRFDRDIRLSAARVAWLSLESVESVRDGNRMVVRITLHAHGGGVDRRYRVSRGGEDFDHGAFQELGQTLLGDGAFWGGVAHAGARRMARAAAAQQKTIERRPDLGAGVTSVETFASP